MTYSKFVRNFDRRNFNMINDKNENILPQKVYLAKNLNEINIDNSP